MVGLLEPLDACMHYLLEYWTTGHQLAGREQNVRDASLHGGVRS